LKTEGILQTKLKSIAIFPTEDLRYLAYFTPVNLIRLLEKSVEKSAESLKFFQTEDNFYWSKLSDPCRISQYTSFYSCCS